MSRIYEYYYKLQMTYSITATNYTTADIRRGRSLEPETMSVKGANFSKIQSTDRG